MLHQRGYDRASSFASSQRGRGQPKVLMVQTSNLVDQRVSTLRDEVEADGYRVEIATSVAQGLESFATDPPALVLLSSFQQPSSVIEMCRRMRAMADVPVVVGFPLGSQTDAVLAYELGVVHYINDPSRTKELMARVRAALRLPENDTGEWPVQRSGVSGTFVAGDIRVDMARHQVTVAGSPVHLSRLEFDLLALLLDPPCQVHTRDEIMRTVWAGRQSPSSRTLDTHIRWLRQKLEENPTRPKHLLTVWGVGFRFDARQL